MSANTLQEVSTNDWADVTLSQPLPNTAASLQDKNMDMMGLSIMILTIQRQDG
eukprot:UN10388